MLIVCGSRNTLVHEQTRCILKATMHIHLHAIFQVHALVGALSVVNYAATQGPMHAEVGCKTLSCG